MKKLTPVLVLFILIALVVVSWSSVIQGQAEEAKALQDSLQKAQAFEEKGILVDAIKNYEAVFNADKGNHELAIKIASLYYELGNYNDFLSFCDTAIAIDRGNVSPYLLKIEYYISQKEYSSALKAAKNARSAVGENAELESILQELSTTCVEKYSYFASVGDWNTQENISYLAVEENSRWGLALKDGRRKVRPQFDSIGIYDAETGVIPCSADGAYYYIDINGYKKLVGDKDYQYLGSFGNGLAPALREGSYGYIDLSFHEEHFEYDYAGAFANDIAAVRKGNRWALINSKFKEITGFDYDEILMDSYGFCSTFDVIIAREGNGYYFLDHKGNRIGTQSYDGAALPAEDGGMIAVRVGDAWGFADTAGKLIIQPQYQCAKSFSKGLAPIQQEGAWGFVDDTGKVIIEPRYEDAGVFSADGSAPVKQYSSWHFLVLCQYDN